MIKHMKKILLVATILSSLYGVQATAMSGSQLASFKKILQDAERTNNLPEVSPRLERMIVNERKSYPNTAFQMRGMLDEALQKEYNWSFSQALAKLEQLNAALNEEQNKRSEQIQQLQQTGQNTRNQLKQLVQENNKLQQQLADFKQKEAQSKSVSESEQKEYVAATQALKDEIEKITNTNTELKQQLEDNKAELEANRSLLTAQDEETNQLKAEIEKLAKEKETLSSVSSESEKSLKTLKEDLARANKEITELTNLTATHEVEFKNLTATHQEEIKALKKQKQDLTQERDKLTARNNALIIGKEKDNEEIERLIKRVATLETENSKLRQAEPREKGVEVPVEKIIEKIVTIAESCKECPQHQEQITNLGTENAHLQAQLADLEAKLAEQKPGIEMGEELRTLLIRLLGLTGGSEENLQTGDLKDFINDTNSIIDLLLQIIGKSSPLAQGELARHLTGILAMIAQVRQLTQAKEGEFDATQMIADINQLIKNFVIFLREQTYLENRLNLIEGTFKTMTGLQSRNLEEQTQFPKLAQALKNAKNKHESRLAQRLDTPKQIAAVQRTLASAKKKLEQRLAQREELKKQLQAGGISTSAIKESATITTTTTEKQRKAAALKKIKQSKGKH